jgi:hypothetical protein
MSSETTPKKRPIKYMVKQGEQVTREHVGKLNIDILNTCDFVDISNNIHVNNNLIDIKKDMKLNFTEEIVSTFVKDHMYLFTECIYIKKVYSKFGDETNMNEQLVIRIIMNMLYTFYYLLLNYDCDQIQVVYDDIKMLLKYGFKTSLVLKRCHQQQNISIHQANTCGEFVQYLNNPTMIYENILDKYFKQFKSDKEIDLTDLIKSFENKQNWKHIYDIYCKLIKNC